jgi:hypothetical protein
MKKLRNFFLSTICIAFITPVMAKENQITVHVKKNSIAAGEDTLSFKTTTGVEYSIATNPDYETKGWQFVDDRKKMPICLTLNPQDKSSITAIEKGQCK